MLNKKNINKLVVCKGYPDYYHVTLEENQTLKIQFHF